MIDWNVSEEAAQLHADSLVWDMTFPFGDYSRSERKWLALERMHASGYNMVSLTVGGDRNTSGDASMSSPENVPGSASVPTTTC